MGEDRIEAILKDFEKLINKELKISSIFKISEELTRYLFYKSLIKNGVEDKDISYEANFSNKTIDKVDLKFLNNYIEIKFHRELENKRPRPYWYSFARLIADFFKLSNSDTIEKSNKYILYVFDEIHKSKLSKYNFGFLFEKNFKVSIDKIKNYNKTVRDELEKKIWTEQVNSSLIYSSALTIPQKFRLEQYNNKLNIYFYKIQ